MSESGQSASSYGFESTAGSDRLGLAGPEAADDGKDGMASFEAGVFGVLFTVSKEKNPSKVFVGFRLFMDWIQVFLLLVNPSYGWNINTNSKLWQAFNFIQLNYFMSTRGYTFFLICMYVLAVALAANLGLCVWVANSFKNNSFNHVWPIVWLRYFSLVFYQVLDVASLTLFLMTMDCQYFSVEKSDQGFNQEFPTAYCWTMPHLIHIIVAAAAIAIFFLLAIVFQMAEIELNPVSKNLMGMAHTKVEVWGFAIKMFMTCTSVFVTGVQWMSVFQLISNFMLCYLYLKWLPHLHETINHIRVGCYFSTFWAALLLTIMAYHPGYYVHDDAGRQKQANALTAALWALFIPVGFGGAALSWWRTRYFSRVVVGKFRDAPLDAKARKIYKFTDPREVEIASRCCRVWVDEDTLEQEGVLLAERICKAGVALLPHQPYMAIWWSSFLIDVQGSYQSGYAELQDAKKMPNQSFLERFCIFIREQEHTQKASAATSGDNASIDLVSYVEFQRNYRLALQLHMDALVAKRTFWETLLHHTVTFNKMAQAVERIETTVKASERMYRQVLARHSNSVKIVSLYVKFLQGVRNDPWSAARWGAELEKMQRMEEEANERAVFGNGSDQKAGGLQNDDSKGVIIMGANCLIRMINEPAANMIGYSNKNELVGKNINIIVPPPFARNHNNYVRNYIHTGQSKVLNQLREFVAMHKDRYVVPINLYITKVSGVGEDSVFMGIFSPVTVEPDTASLWCLNGGMVLSCDATFTDWLGYKHEDIHSRPLTELALNKEKMEQFLDRIRNDVASKAEGNRAITSPDGKTTRSDGDKPEGIQPGKPQSRNSQPKVWSATGVKLKHLYVDLAVCVDMTVTVGGIGETAMYACRVTRSEDNTPVLMVTDSKGRIQHVTSKLANKLGTTVSKLQAGNAMHALDALLPPAFARTHHTWYRERPDKIPPWSCRSGLTMCLNAMATDGPSAIPFAMDFKRKDLPSREPVNVVLLEQRTMPQALDERRLALTLDSHGVITRVGDSSATLFGFEPFELVGVHISNIVNVLKPLARSTSPTLAQIKADEETATKMLMHMAETSYHHPGMSWRVGVIGTMDPVALDNLGPMGIAMMAKRIVPAVMVVDAFLEPPTLKGARIVLPGEMQLKVELWRADLIGGVLELDTQGNVVQPGIKGQPMYNANLLLGLPAAMMNGINMSSIVSLQGKPLLEALFTEGGLAPHKAGMGRGAGGRAAGRGGMRSNGQYTRRRGSGPVHTIKIRHGTDAEDLEISLQAVVKQDIGVGCSLYILMHVLQPGIGRRDFSSWIWDAPAPAPPAKVGLGKTPSRRGSTVMNSEAGIRSVAQSSMASPTFPAAFQPQLNQVESKPKFLEVAALPYAQDSKPAYKDAVIEKPKVKLFQPEEEVEPLFDDTPMDFGIDLDHPRTPPIRSSTRESEEAMLEPVSTTLPNAVLDTDNEIPIPTVISPLPSPKKAKAVVKPKLRPNSSSPRKALPKKSDSRMSVTSRKSSITQQKKKSSVIGNDSDDDSVASGKSGLKEGGRERISNWMSSASIQHERSESEDSESEEDEDDQHAAMADDQQHEDHDHDNEIDQLDEAGSGVNDYKRGKRLKKLAKVLMGPQAQAPNVRLRLVSIIVVVVLIAVDFAMFFTFLSMTTKQTEQIHDLRSSAKAVNRVMMTAIDTSAIEIILGGKATGNLRHLGQDGSQASLDFLTAQMETWVSELEVYHTGVYRGFGKLRRLPDSYGLRSLWEEPTLNIRTFYTADTGTFGINTNESLWDAGNLLIKSYRNILQNFERYYGLSTNNSMAYTNSTDVLFIEYNAPRSIMDGYQMTLDGLMQQAIQDSTKMNDIQLIILAVEGGFVGMISVVIVCYVTCKVVFRRYAVFTVFMMVPVGVLRGLATQAFNLEDGGSAEDDQGQNGDDTADQTMENTAAASSGRANGDFSGRGDAEEGKAGLVMATAVAYANGNGADKGFWSRLSDKVAFWRPPAVLQNTKRKLHPSWTAILWITWPFLFWAVFVVVINVVGFQDLAGMSQPIAISNIVQFVSIRVDRVLFFAQRLTSEQYFDSTFTFTASYVPDGTHNPLKVNYANNLLKDYKALRLEYDAMLLGHKSEAVRNETTPHYQLATEGITFTSGADLMFTDVGCLAEDLTECQPPSSPYYRFTMYGLDQMMKQLFFSLESLLAQKEFEQTMDSTYFEYIYEVGNADIRGGLNMLVDGYTKEVQAVYKNALTLHIVALCMCIGLGFIFIVVILLPNFKRTTQESRRVAELLSCLPPDMDVELLVNQALCIHDPQHDVPVGAEKRGHSKSFKANNSDTDDDDYTGGNGRGSSEFPRLKVA